MLITRGWSPPSQKKVTQTCMKSITYNVSLLLLSSLFCVNIKYNYHILSFSFSLAENSQATKNNLKKSKIILTAARHIKSLILTIGINIWVSFFFHLISSIVLKSMMEACYYYYCYCEFLTWSNWQLSNILRSTMIFRNSELCWISNPYSLKIVSSEFTLGTPSWKIDLCSQN